MKTVTYVMTACLVLTAGPASAEWFADVYGGQGGTNQLDVDAYALSLDLILRVPLLKTEKAPWGSIQPYITGGVPVFRTSVTPRTTAQFRNHDGDTDYSVGYKVGGGIAFNVAPNLMLFAEYRLTHVQ